MVLVEGLLEVLVRCTGLEVEEVDSILGGPLCGGGGVLFLRAGITGMGGAGTFEES